MAGFTWRYGLTRLVYFELHGGADSTITREKQLKRWQRRFKIRLIESLNPQWRDLYETLKSLTVTPGKGPG